jgi:hypothetical protein
MCLLSVRLSERYTHRPNNVTVLKQPTEEEIQNIPDDMLSKVMTDVRDTVEECLRKGGSHLTNTVFKNELKICACKTILCVHYAC